MGKDIVKGFTMLLLIVALAFVSAVVSANGQSGRVLVADIPFDFAVGDKALPSGAYTVKAITAGNEALMIRNKDSQSAAMRLTNQINAPKLPAQAKLVFHRYGERYFLSEVWTGEDNTGRQLTKSRQERAIERELASTSVAQARYERVEILATLQ